LPSLEGGSNVLNRGVYVSLQTRFADGTAAAVTVAASPWSPLNQLMDLNVFVAVEWDGW